MSTRRADAPSTGVVVAGGIGVLVVLAFVAALALGGGSRSTPGERVALVSAEGGAEVLAGRCRDQRVVAVEVRDGPTVRWRIESVKGSIDRRYPVGGAPPLGFTTAVPLEGDLPPVVTVEATFDGPDGEERDAALRPVSAPEDVTLGDVAPPCGGSVDLGATVILFAAAAALVVGGYAVMLTRFRRN